MNEYAILHKPDSNFCFPTGEKQIVLRLRTMREDQLEKVSVIYGFKYDFHNVRKECEMKKKYEDRYFDYYEITLDLEDVRLAYVFTLDTEDGRHYFSEDGITKEYDFNIGYFNYFQVPYINKEDVIRTVPWMKEAVFYQIFVDRFFIGNKEKDKSYINLSWGEKPHPKSFTGGDIRGIIEKLDYIASLGANAIYLTPIFSSISNHKYDIANYKEIDPQFGSKEDLKELVEKAHKKGMRIVLDAVFNHCSDKIMQFQDVLEKGKDSEYFDWFFIRGEKPVTNPCNYEVFSSCDYMPKLNTSNPKVREFLIDIACYYITEFDIDGWRLDVSDEISHDFWRAFRNEVKKAKEDCVIIGENWHDAYPFLMGDQFDGIMNYSFTKALLDYFAFDTFTTKDFIYKLNELLVRNKKQINEMMLNLLDTHDTDRFYTQVGKDKDKVLAALAIATCFIGASCVYYGTEHWLEGGYDPDNRRTFDWNEENWDKVGMSVLSQILKVKQENSVQEGDIQMKDIDGVLSLQRYTKKERVTLYYNKGDKDISFVTEASSLLVQNEYSNGVLKAGGFLICKETI